MRQLSSRTHRNFSYIYYYRDKVAGIGSISLKQARTFCYVMSKTPVFFLRQCRLIKGNEVSPDILIPCGIVCVAVSEISAEENHVSNLMNDMVLLQLPTRLETGLLRSLLTGWFCFNREVICNILNWLNLAGYPIIWEDYQNFLLFI